jgi:hypothetical protein
MILGRESWRWGAKTFRHPSLSFPQDRSSLLCTGCTISTGTNPLHFVKLLIFLHIQKAFTQSNLHSSWCMSPSAFANSQKHRIKSPSEWPLSFGRSHLRAHLVRCILIASIVLEDNQIERSHMVRDPVTIEDEQTEWIPSVLIFLKHPWDYPLVHCRTETSENSGTRCN